MNYFITEVSEQEIKRERDKSRELRRSRWWRKSVGPGSLPLVRGHISSG